MKETSSEGVLHQPTQKLDMLQHIKLLGGLM